MTVLKELGRRLVNRAGYTIRKRQPPGSHFRPIGEQDSVFADFGARGFDPAIVFDVAGR